MKTSVAGGHGEALAKWTLPGSRARRQTDAMAEII
jgi:hypothetical protein